MSKPNRKYLFKKKGTVDQDRLHMFSLARNVTTVKKVDMRSLCPPVYDQGELGSCTANAIAGAYQFDEMKEKEKGVITPSRLFIYYGERAIEGTVTEDSGGFLQDGIDFIHQTGVCPETTWAYDINKFTEKPPQNCYTVAENHKCTSFKQLSQNLNQLKQCLINGYPFVFGIQVYDEFESDAVAKTGIVPMPTPSSSNLGGHAIMCVGYDDEHKWFICRNSWGSDWGEKGYFFLPYAYVNNPNLASDFWSIITVVDK